jgi:hypothetical protein
VERRAHRGDDAGALVVRRGRDLPGQDPPARDHRRVRERPADVDADQGAAGLARTRVYHRRPLSHAPTGSRPILARVTLAPLALLALAVPAGPAAAAALPAERTLTIRPPDPVGAADLAGWTWLGPRPPAAAGSASRPALRLELNTTLVSPPTWVPASAQGLRLRLRAPGASSLLVVRADPLDGGPAVELGVVEPGGRAQEHVVGLGPVAGRAVRIVIDPVVAFGRHVEIGQVGPFVAPMPGWRLERGTPLRAHPRAPVIRVRDAPLSARRGISVGPRRAVTVRVRGAGVLELRVGSRRARVRATSAWRTVSVPAPRRGGRLRVELSARPWASALDIAGPGRVVRAAG